MPSLNYSPTYGAPGPGTGWENGRDGATAIDANALDNMESGIIAAVAALNEILTGPLGTLVLAYSKLPVGTTAGTIAAGDDSRLGAIDPLLAFAPILVYEAAAGHYTRPATTRPVWFVGTVAPTNGGTTAGGTGTAVAVAGLDFKVNAA